jgi:malonate-semialdehyde dehydrogenase (acetylating)/methylmalonate-semialdehyde dehydrogenase
MQHTIGHFINNAHFAGDSKKTIPIHDPATGEACSHVMMASKEDTILAIEAAHKAFPAWSRTPPMSRARILFRFKALLEQHEDELAELISREHGKVLSDAKGELTRGKEVVEFACGIPHLLKGEHSQNVGSEVDTHSLMMPLGVCVGISPFNFPVMVPMWMFPVAIAAGNTFILKPSEKDPSVAMRMAELLAEAGLPQGVFNVINGDKEAVDVLLTDHRVEAISFVGSTPVAEYIYATGSARGKRVQALGGAKNHLVVMPDADLDQAINALMGAAYGSAGERCMAISVAVAVTDEVGDALVRRLEERVRTLKVGPGYGVTDENDMGPLISEEHRARVRDFVESGVEQGARLVVDGRGVNVPGHEAGYFIGGCLFDNVQPDMDIYQQEIFGPVLSIVRVPDYDAAVSLVNAHEYGNGTAIFTRDGNTARNFGANIQVGMVGINVPIPVPMAFHCFGGWKRSLFGPLHMHGPDGVRFFTKMKTITSRWPTGASQNTNFNMPTLS